MKENNLGFQTNITEIATPADLDANVLSMDGGDDDSVLGPTAHKDNDREEGAERINFAFAAEENLARGEDAAQTDVLRAEGSQQTALGLLATAMKNVFGFSDSRHVKNSFSIAQREATARAAAMQMVQKAQNMLVAATTRVNNGLAALRSWAAKRAEVHADVPQYRNDPGIIVTPGTSD